MPALRRFRTPVTPPPSAPGLPAVDPRQLARWREWMNLKSNLVWIYEGPIPTYSRRGSFHPDHLAAWLVLEGQAELQQEDRITVATAGQWLIPWPGQRTQIFSDDARILSVRFQWEWPDGFPLFERGLSLAFPREAHPGLESAARDLLARTRTLLPNDPVALSHVELPFGTFIEIKGCFFRWLAAFYEAMIACGLRPTRIGIGDDRVAAAVQNLDTRPLSDRVLEEDLATEIGLGVSQFVRLFREEMGVTPKRYFDERRRIFCRRMLKNTAVPIKQIAYDLGFHRLSDFSAWFKDAHGASPRQFRAHHIRGFAL